MRPEKLRKTATGLSSLAKAAAAGACKGAGGVSRRWNNEETAKLQELVAELELDKPADSPAVVKQKWAAVAKHFPHRTVRAPAASVLPHRQPL
jgi:hypothetical protein